MPDAHFEGVTPVEPAELRSQTAADNLVSRATTTKQALNSRMVGVRPLMSVFRPMLAKKTGGEEGCSC